VKGAVTNGSGSIENIISISRTPYRSPDRQGATISDMPDQSDKRDPDMENAGAALTRAGKRAKLLAAFTGTAYVVVRDGKLISEIPDLAEVLKEQDAREGWQIELLDFAKAVGLNWHVDA